MTEAHCHHRESLKTRKATERPLYARIFALQCWHVGLVTCNWWPVVPGYEKPKIHLDIQKTESPPSGVQSTQEAESP